MSWLRSAAAGALALAGLTACSGDDDKAAGGPTAPLVTGTPSSGGTPSAGGPGRQLRAAEVVSALTAKGYRCSADSTYQVCRNSGPVAVWVLTGDHPRVAVVSLHARGAVRAAFTAVGSALPQVLATAHVNESAQVAAWFGEQTGRATATKVIGDWRVELSAESDTEEPGVHLTLNDRFCKANCRAE